MYLITRGTPLLHVQFLENQGTTQWVGSVPTTHTRGSLLINLGEIQSLTTWNFSGKVNYKAYFLYNVTRTMSIQEVMQATMRYDRQKYHCFFVTIPQAVTKDRP